MRRINTTTCRNVDEDLMVIWAVSGVKQALVRKKKHKGRQEWKQRGSKYPQSNGIEGRKTTYMCSRKRRSSDFRTAGKLKRRYPSEERRLVKPRDSPEHKPQKKKNLGAKKRGLFGSVPRTPTGAQSPKKGTIGKSEKKPVQRKSDKEE